VADFAQNPIPQYSRSIADKLYADRRESLFGHLVVERGRSVKTALEELRPHVKQALKATESAASWCQKLGIGGVGLGVLVGTSMGIGYAALPILAGCLSLKFWADSRDEMPRREAEFHLLRECSNLPEALFALHLRGVSTPVLVGSYDSLISAVEARLERNAEFSEAEVWQFLEAKIKALGTIAPVTTQSQPELQPIDAPQNNGESPRAKGEALASTEIQALGIAQEVSTIAPTVAAAAPSLSNINGIETIAPRDIATDLGNHPQSALIFGTPGAGKGMNISNAIRTLRAKLPAVTVMMVDPKGDLKERGYWESQVDIFESRSLLKSSPRSSAEWMMRCIEKFQNIDGPKLLVWDELFASIVVLKGQNIPKGEEPFPCLTDFQQFISLNLSLGPSSGTWVWGMSQSANLSDLGLTSGGLSTTRIIALISPDNVGAVEGYLATKAIAAPKGGMEYLDRLMEQSPVGRACYDGKTKKWYPVARLENHSGFDRDNADWNNLGKPSQPIAPPSPPSIENDWRETFAKSLPANLSENEFKQRYELERMLRESSSLEPQKWSTAPTDNVEQQPIDLGIEACYEIISGEPDDDLKQALMISFDWFIKDKGNGRELNKETFLNRAKTNRKSLRLKEDRQSIWNELEEIITYYDGL